MKHRASRPALAPSRAAEIYEVMTSYRREVCADSDFFLAPDFWDYLCEGDGDWTIKIFKSGLGDDYVRRAGVIAFDGRVRLTADQELWVRAKKGCNVANFILSHELAHLALGHHEKNAVIKNFKLFSGPRGMSNIPPTVEEEEANIGAAFLQCGPALLNVSFGFLDLAKRAHCDPPYVKRAQSLVRLEPFQRALRMPKLRYPRVVL